jgi:predicted short-subunit dehydrogenase-like oxidoreductase (DUF2520 family)
MLPVIRARRRVANRNMLNKRVAIGIAGAGRVAQVLGRLLSESGQPVVAIAGRNPERTAGAARFIGTHTTPTTLEKLPALASRILIAVSDTAVEPVASLLARSGFQHGVALHTCGAKGPQALMVLAHAGVNCGALHPLQSFTSAAQGTASVGGSFFAIDGDPEAIEWASSIVTQVGCRSVRIRAEDRSLYHAAAVMASNYITALVYGAVEVLKAAGLDRATALAALAPLVKTSAENSLSLGPIEALTGPIARGDTTTVMAHLNALRNLPEPVNRLYGSAGELTVQMAVLRGLPESKAAEIEEILRTVQ